MKYQSDLRQLGFQINVQLLNKDNLYATMNEEGPQPISQLHNIQEVFNNDDSYIQNCLDIQRTIDAFTPDDTLPNVMLGDTEICIEDIFTPELPQNTQDNVYEGRCPSNNFHDNVNELSFQHSLSEKSDYRNLSNFIGENSENLYKLYPEVNIIQDESTGSSNGLNTIDDMFSGQTLHLQSLGHYYDIPKYTQNNNSVNIFQDSNPLLSLPSPSMSRYSISDIKDSGSVYSEIIRLNHFNNSNTVATIRKCDMETFRLESLKGELEIMSEVFSQNADFDEDTPLCFPTNNDQNVIPRYISPIVNVIEGPNNTTLSIDENESSVSNVQEEEEDRIEVKTENEPCQEIIEVENVEEIIQISDLNAQSIEIALDTNINDFSTDISFKTCFSTSIHNDTSEFANQDYQNCVSLHNKSPNISDDNNTLTERSNQPNTFSEEDNLSNSAMNGAETKISDSNNEQINQTNISEASKLRNLECSTSSTDRDNENGNDNRGEDESTLSNEKIIPPKNVGNMTSNKPYMSPLPNEDKTKTTSSTNDQKNLSSISCASKLRNLDGTTSSSSSNKLESKKMFVTLTSISDISKKRNLDSLKADVTYMVTDEKNDSHLEENSLDEPIPKKPFLKRTNDSVCDLQKINSGKVSKITADRNLTPTTTGTVRKEKETIHPEQDTSSSIKESTNGNSSQTEFLRRNLSTGTGTQESSGSPKATTLSKSKKNKLEAITNVQDQPNSYTNSNKKGTKRRTYTLMKRFNPPRKLTVKEIKEEFKKQDSIMFDKSASSSDMSRYYEQLINRPTVRQIQNSTSLATLVRTSEGVRVIPTKPVKKQKKGLKLLKKYRSNDSINGINMSIFSDSNAIHFEEYLKSNEKDYKSFSSSFSKNVEAAKVHALERKKSDETGFEFVSLQSTSFASCFMRKESKNTIQSHRTIFNAESTLDETLTPDGYYKRNKEDINKIVRKYLPNAQQSSANSTNMFQNDTFSPDLTL